MSFCLRPNVCKKCGKPLTMFEGWICFECEKAEQEPLESEDKDEHFMPIQSLTCDDINDIIDGS